MQSSNTTPIATGSDWRGQLRDVITSGADLLQALGIAPGDAGFSEQASADFALRVPRAFVRRMRPGDPSDPLLRQVLATGGELLPAAGFVDDPIGETGVANSQPGLVHKYAGRVLLIVAGGCAVHCRYCFRRHFPYEDNLVGRSKWLDALETVRRDGTIREVILSGGDPLVATDSHLAELASAVAGIPHVSRLRIHTRLPVVIPDRVDDGLLAALATRLHTSVVLHCNHANEIDADVTRAVTALRGEGITVLNQAVLLAGVNDSAEAQVDLAERLFAAGILPYYLHLLDRVRGAAHFEVSEQRARALHAEMRACLPGYLVPRLAREVAGEPSKTVLA